MDASVWDERYASAELVWSATPRQFVEAECAGLPAGRALDLAAGRRHDSSNLTEGTGGLQDPSASGPPRTCSPT